MARHLVTNDRRTFQQLAQDLQSHGIRIDHFHAVVGTGEEAQRLHLNRQADGSFQPKRGALPSQRIDDYTSVIADEWHHR